MKFGLRTLLATITLLSVFFAIAFAVPLPVAAPVLATLVLIGPSVWITGACFARQPWRAFFVGGIAAAWLPQILVIYYAAMLGGGFVISPGKNGIEEALATRLILCGVILAPTLLALLGGGCGVIVYRLFGPPTAAKVPPASSSQLHEPYLLLESRVTPLERSQH